MINKKAEFAVKILKQYAHENGLPGRSTSDLSPLEEWLILQLFPIKLKEYKESFLNGEDLSAEEINLALEIIKEDVLNRGNRLDF